MLDGHDVLVAAPTAGGKTEAVMLLLLSRAEVERWRGLSVLYICPLRALMNNLSPDWPQWPGGAGAAPPSGTVTSRHRRAAGSPPTPDILLTTPESLEAMLLSAQTDHRWPSRPPRGGGR